MYRDGALDVRLWIQILDHLVCLGGLRVEGSGLRVEGAGFRVQGSGLRVQGSGFRIRKTK